MHLLYLNFSTSFSPALVCPSGHFVHAMLASNDLRISMSGRRRKSPDADRRERRYSSRSPPPWRSPPTAMRSDKHTETRLPRRSRSPERRGSTPKREGAGGRDDRERGRCENRGRDSERRDEREREHRDEAPKRWREGGRWMQMYVGDGIGDIFILKYAKIGMKCSNRYEPRCRRYEMTCFGMKQH